jgi:hypothetical protein
MEISLVLLNRPGNNDKRRWHRYPLGAPIRLKTQSATIDARGITLSEGGMCLFALADIGVGSKIQVEFTDPRSCQLVRADAAIRNRAVYLYGIEFLPGKNPN